MDAPDYMDHVDDPSWCGDAEPADPDAEGDEAEGDEAADGAWPEDS